MYSLTFVVGKSASRHKRYIFCASLMGCTFYILGDKRMKKIRIYNCLFKLFIITILLFAFCQLEAGASNYEFSDLPKEHWAYEYVNQMAKEGIVNGYADGTFAPDKPVTRAEFCKIVSLAAGKVLPSLDEARNSYYSVPGIEGHWAELYMAVMAKDTWNYVDWYLSKNVNPDQPINRGEAAMGIGDIWYGYPRSYITRETEIREYLSNKFTDYEKFGGFWTVVYEASKEGFINGYEDGTFRCGKQITRAELCAILYRAFSKKSDETGDGDTGKINLYGTIVLNLNKESYLLYRSINNRLQKINGSPYLSEKDLEVRITTDLGDGILEKALDELNRTASGWGRSYTENIICFVQNDIEYLYDGKDRDYAKFPYETLFDRGGDCEDKAILLCALLDKAGYKVCMIVFSDHVGLGVAMVNDISGGYYYRGSDGTKYYYLETTSPGWQIGELPEDYINEDAYLIYP